MGMRHTLTFMVMAAALWAAGCGKPIPESAPPQVQVETVKKMETSGGRVKYSASIAPYTQTNLIFENSAYVQDIMHVSKNGKTVLIDKGDAVPSGTVLATQDSSEFEAKAAQARAQVKTAQANVTEAQAKLSQAQASQEQAYANLTNAQENYNAAMDKIAQAQAVKRQGEATLAKAGASRFEYQQQFQRANVLYADNAMIKPEYDKATANYEESVANVANARAQIQQAVADISAAQAQARSAQATIISSQAQVKSAAANVQAARDQIAAANANEESAAAQLTQAEVKLSHCTLRVPTDSVVVSRNIEPGALAGPANAAFVVADIRRVKVDFGVPDLEVEQVTVGQQVRVAVEAFPALPIKGRVSSISPSADQKGRVYEVTVLLDNSDRKLKNGMIASIELLDRRPKKATVAVPLSALVRSPRNMDAYAVVLVVNDNGKTVVKFQDVKLGRALGNMVEIEEGLKVNDRVVTSGNNMVRDGDPVQVQQ